MINTNNLKVGIYGGTFDPVHLGHINLALQAKTQFLLDKVVFIPANTSPHKESQPVTAAFHRLAMLTMALEDYSNFYTSTIEINRKGTSYTVDTLEMLGESMNNSDLYLIMGADSFLELNTWKEYRRLTSLVNILVGNRPGFPLLNPKIEVEKVFGKENNPYCSIPSKPSEFSHQESKHKLYFFQIPPKDIASRKIRTEKIPSSSNKKILPPQVDQYIIVNQLYKERLFPL
ncbi:MAG: nicotinate-nucleotide adenylyltransferase [Nitrospinales bacterium]